MSKHQWTVPEKFDRATLKAVFIVEKLADGTCGWLEGWRYARVEGQEVRAATLAEAEIMYRIVQGKHTPEDLVNLKQMLQVI